MASTRAPGEHYAYNTNAEFANLRPYRACYRGLDVESMLDAALPSAIALTICTRKGNVPTAMIVAAAIVNVIRRRAANQFRKSGMLLIPQPSIAQKR